MQADLEATQALAEERLAALEAARRETERLRAESAGQKQQVLELQLLLEGAGLGVSLSQEHTGRRCLPTPRLSCHSIQPPCT